MNQMRFNQKEAVFMSIPTGKPINEELVLALKREMERCEASGEHIELKLSDVTASELLYKIEHGKARITSHDGIDNYMARLRALAEEESKLK
jgi:hypothetical protein